MYSVILKGIRPSKCAKMVYDPEARTYYRGLRETLFYTKGQAEKVVKEAPEHIRPHLYIGETMIL